MMMLLRLLWILMLSSKLCTEKDYTVLRDV